MFDNVVQIIPLAFILNFPLVVHLLHPQILSSLPVASFYLNVCSCLLFYLSPGPAQSNVWDSMVPSKKRTGVNRPKPSPFEKLTKDLYTILHEQQSSYFSGSSEEDLLLESETPMVSVEIGHGSVLIRHPSSIAREEESEASSLSVENKQYSINGAYSHSPSFSAYNDSKGIKFSGHGIERAKNPAGQGMQHEQFKR